MRDKLRKDLEAAAQGYAAQHGAGVRNLFADALAELDRLDVIEEDVKRLFQIRVPIQQRKDASWVVTTAEAVQERIDTGRRLGVAVGAHGFAPALKAVGA